MNDIETIQRERGWRECERHNDCGEWHRGRASKGGLPDPLADTPEGWWEFGQIIKWAEEWAANNGAQIHIVNALYANDPHEWHVNVTDVAGIEHGGHGVGDFRAAFIAALAAAIRHESEATE